MHVYCFTSSLQSNEWAWIGKAIEWLIAVLNANEISIYTKYFYKQLFLICLTVWNVNMLSFIYRRYQKNTCIIIHQKVSTFLYISSQNISQYVFKAITFQFCKRNKKDIHHLISCIIIKKIYIWTCVSLVIQISFIWIAKLISYQDVSFVSENVINEISAYAPVFNYVSLPPLFSALSLTTVLSNTKCINMSITSLSSLYPFSGLFFIHFLPSTILDAINDMTLI